MGGFCLAEELNQGGSATNGDTPSSLSILGFLEQLCFGISFFNWACLDHDPDAIVIIPPQLIHINRTFSDILSTIFGRQTYCIAIIPGGRGIYANKQELDGVGPVDNRPFTN